MTRADRLLILLVGGLVLLLALLEMAKPKPLDWTRSYTHHDTRPYGSRLLYERLADLFPNSPRTLEYRAPFRTLFSDRSDSTFTYLFITDEFDPDPFEGSRLLEHIAQGGVAFLATDEVGKEWRDTLRLEQRFYWIDDDTPPASPDSTGSPILHEVLSAPAIPRVGRLLDPALEPDSAYTFLENAGGFYFSAFDTARTAVLGTNHRGDANFIHIAFGEGALFIHLIPEAFTNYNVVHPQNHAYVAKVLSYLPDGPELVWDTYHKPIAAVPQTRLRVILSSPSLRWGYFLALATLVLFVIFRGKRRQRILPEIEPPRNTTVEFVETVGRLYFQHGDHANLARKKITYFLDYVRTKLNVPTVTQDDEFFHLVAERSRIAEDRVRTLFREMQQIQQQPRVTAAALANLNRQIESFYADSVR